MVPRAALAPTLSQPPWACVDSSNPRGHGRVHTASTSTSARILGRRCPARVLLSTETALSRAPFPCLRGAVRLGPVTPL